MMAEFPQHVSVRVTPPTGGLAVLIIFEMSRKNDFSYTVFLGPDGTVNVLGIDLLTWFDQEATTFLMDYVDPRVAFTGHVFSRILTTEELAGALKTFQLYSKYMPYPEGYEANLRAALAHGQDPSEYSVEVEITPHPDV